MLAHFTLGQNYPNPFNSSSTIRLVFPKTTSPPLTFLYDANKATVIEKRSGSPQTTILHQNYPNPFNPHTSISYQLSEAGHVRLRLFDLLGRELAVLVDEFKLPGRYSCNCDMTRMGLASSGMYYYQLQHQMKSLAKKLIFVQ